MLNKTDRQVDRGRRWDTRLMVIIQSGNWQNLTAPQRRFLKALRDRIERSGLGILPDLPATANMAERLSNVARCQGVAVVAFRQWEGQRLSRNQKKIFPTEFTHISVALATAEGRPIFVLREKSVAERGALRRGFGAIIDLPNSLNVRWLDSDKFQLSFNKWLQDVDEYKHIFLGYSSQATKVGRMVREFLVKDLKLRVFEWQQDFLAGVSIWESIARAEQLTSCGIFLFMADDAVTTAGGQHRAPRDNVVYEAGYFAGAKGLSRSIIIHERGAKVPADLDGIIRIPIENRRILREKLRNQIHRLITSR
jgi:hypothetical protein